MSKEMIGVVVAIDLCGEDGVLFTLEDGRKFKMEHFQDCCEHVYMETGKDEVMRLKGKNIIRVDVELNRSGRDNDCASQTDTIFTFTTTDETVVIRWHGSSNGYYSETADLYDVTNGRW